MTASYSSITSNREPKKFLARGLLSMGIPCGGLQEISRTTTGRKKNKEEST